MPSLIGNKPNQVPTNGDLGKLAYMDELPYTQATRTITEITATAGQTAFVANGGYTVGYIDVFLNGAQLQTVDFTATNGSSITLTEAAQVGDVIRLVAWGTFATSTHVLKSGDTVTGGLNVLGNLGVGTSSPAVSIDARKASDVQIRAFETGLGVDTRVVSVGGAGQAGIIGTYSNHPLVTYTNGAERVRVDTSGNVGIGTSSPTFGGGGGLQVRNASDANVRITSVGYTGLDLLQQSGTGWSYIWNRDNAPMLFGTNNTERMRIDASGNLLFNSGYGSVATAYGCRAWVDFNGTGTVAIRASGNVTSITDNGTGTFVVNLTTAMPDMNYAAVSDSNNGTTAGASSAMRSSSARPLSTSTVGFYAFPNDASGTLADSDYNHLAVFR